MATEQREIEVESRAELGSGEARRMRKLGQVPGVVYGGGGAALPVFVEGQQFWLTRRGCATTQLFTFRSKDSTLNGIRALIKDIQVDPLKDRIIHIDFLSVREGQKVTLSIPIHLSGESPAVKDGRAVLNQTAFELDIESEPHLMPESIAVDISGLEESKSIHASDVLIPAGCALRSNPLLTIASAISLKRIEAQEAAAAAAAQEAAGAVPVALAEADATAAEAPVKEGKDGKDGKEGKEGKDRKEGRD